MLDPCLGSGTTCYAARALGRRSIGVDVDPTYCATAATRLGRPAPIPGAEAAER